MKSELDKKFIFRRSERTIAGYVTIDKPIGYPMISKWVKRISLLLGFEHNTIRYNLRYIAGNKLDQSRESL